MRTRIPERKQNKRAKTGEIGRFVLELSTYEYRGGAGRGKGRESLYEKMWQPLTSWQFTLKNWKCELFCGICKSFLWLIPIGKAEQKTEEYETEEYKTEEGETEEKNRDFFCYLKGEETEERREWNNINTVQAQRLYELLDWMDLWC